MWVSDCSVLRTLRLSGDMNDVKLKSRAGYDRMIATGRGTWAPCSRMRFVMVVQMFPPAESPVRTMRSLPDLMPRHSPPVWLMVTYASMPSSMAQGYGSVVS